MSKLSEGRFCIVNEEMFGQVQYITPDGFYGVQIDGEGERVDEWNPVQVRGCNDAEAVQAAQAMAKGKK